MAGKRAPVATLEHPAFPKGKAVLMSDGSVFAPHEHKNVLAWRELTPIPGTDAARQGDDDES